MDRSDTPRQLLDRLRSDDPDASQLLESMVGDQLRCLIDRAREHGLLPDDDNARLYANVLASLRLGLRLKSSTKLNCLTPPELGCYLLVASSRLLGLGTPDIRVPPPPKNNSATEDGFLHGYSFGCWSRPLYHVSGDVHAVSHDTDGLWILVADVTGHSRVAHAVACAVALLWSACLADEVRPNSLDELVARMDRELTSCLPLGEFVEAAIARANSAGIVTIVAAGGIQFLYARSPIEQPAIQTARGHWLGLGEVMNECREQANLDLTASGSEVVLGTDGLFDQANGEGVPLRKVLSSLQNADNGAALVETVKSAFLMATTNGRDQHDDTTIVSLRRL
jgi:hypothetical protein